MGTSQSTCRKCKIDIGQAALVRCRDSECPARIRGSDPESRVIGPVGITAILALLCLLSVQYFKSSSAPRTDSATPAIAESADNATLVDRTATSETDSGGFWSWFSSAPAPSPPPVAVKTDEYLFDPRAATRVSSFSCEGSLSASRERVCSNWGLAIMDYNMSLLQQSAMSQGSSPKTVRATQKAFQRELDRIGGDVNKVRQLYQRRIEELSKQI